MAGQCFQPIAEPVIQQILQALLGLEVVLTCAAFITLISSSYLRSMIPSYDLYEANKFASQAASSTTALDYIIFISALSIIVHASAIRIWTNLSDASVRMRMKRLVNLYTYIRAVFVAMVFAGTVLSITQQVGLTTAQKITASITGVDRNPLSITITNNLGWFLALALVIEVSYTNNTYTYATTDDVMPCISCFFR